MANIKKTQKKQKIQTYLFIYYYSELQSWLSSTQFCHAGYFHSNEIMLCLDDIALPLSILSSSEEKIIEKEKASGLLGVFHIVHVNARLKPPGMHGTHPAARAFRTLINS